MTAETERLEILNMIQEGTISTEEGLKLIEALEESMDYLSEQYLEAAASEYHSELTQSLDQKNSTQIMREIEKWKGWWIIPFGLGVGSILLGGALMYWAWSVRGFSFGFILAWIPFLAGIGISILGWNSKTGPWIHIRIQQKSGEKPERIAFSLPLPLRFSAWVLRNLGGLIPNLDATGIDEIILALGNSSAGDQPLSINVRDDDGEQVDIYLG
jgi:hypothetical protein